MLIIDRKQPTFPVATISLRIMWPWEWVKDWADNILADHEYPTSAQLSTAFSISQTIVSGAMAMKNKVKHNPVKYKDAIAVIDEFLQALRNDHGGTYPHDIFKYWRRQRRTVSWVGGLLTLSTRFRSSGSVCTRRSRACRASALQLFVI